MEPVLMSLLGGTQAFLGPAVGALIFASLKELVSGLSEFHWMMVLGVLLVVIILALPEGILQFTRTRLLLWTNKGKDLP